MKTDDLIARLAASPVPGPGPGQRLAWAVPLALALWAAPVVMVLGIRPDLGAALADPLTAMKWLLPLTVALVSLGFAHRLSRPEARLGRRALVHAPVVMLGLGLVGAALADLPVAAWGPVIRGGTRAVCLTAIVGMSLGPLGAMLWALRRGAPTRPRLSGLMAGLAAGGLAATLYALHCNEDAAPFFVTWYGTAILTSGAIGAALGPRVLRW